jgi:hypothetical protein
MYDGKIYTSGANPYYYIGNVYVKCDKNVPKHIYDYSKNKWAQTINTNTMTQQEFNDLRVGNFIYNYEIIHKYNEFLIVRCDNGHDLFDLAKINKLGLKVQPKTFMGLEIKDYDNAPCEINGDVLFYLVEVRIDDILIRCYKENTPHSTIPSSIRIL